MNIKKWFKKKKDGSEDLKKATAFKHEVAERVQRRMDLIQLDRRIHDMPFDGEDRRLRTA